MFFFKVSLFNQSRQHIFHIFPSDKETHFLNLLFRIIYSKSIILMKLLSELSVLLVTGDICGVDAWPKSTIIQVNEQRRASSSPLPSSSSSSLSAAPCEEVSVAQLTQLHSFTLTATSNLFIQPVLALTMNWWMLCCVRSQNTLAKPRAVTRNPEDVSRRLLSAVSYLSSFIFCKVAWEGLESSQI